MANQFKILKKSKKSLARLGVLITSHGKILTPAFLPVASQATVKGLLNRDIKEIGLQGIFVNAFFLYLRPGDKTIKKMGGVHKFMNLEDRVIFSDSGGFQIFSLGKSIEQGVGKIASIFPDSEKVKKRQRRGFVKITEEGVKFTSPIDGSKHFISPEDSIKIQQNIGADIIFSFDECTSPLDDYKYTKRAMQRTHSWAKRCLKKFQRGKGQSLYGIVQGGCFRDLREESARFINSLDFFGYGIGGSLGRTKRDMLRILDWVNPILDERKPRHLLGIGSLEDIKKCVCLGIDTFDCVMPTRLARHGVALTGKGRMDLKKKKYQRSQKAIEPNCQCYTCRNFKVSYISHLIRVKEIAGISLLTYHNLFFMKKLFERIRKEIREGKL